MRQISSCPWYVVGGLRCVQVCRCCAEAGDLTYLGPDEFNGPHAHAQDHHDDHDDLAIS